MDRNDTIPTEDCTLETCPLEQGLLNYLPNVGANAFFAAWFGVLLILQIFHVAKYRTWGYFVAMFSGLLLEILGYVGRIQMHSNPFTMSSYLLYLVCLTIAPAFFGAAVYLCLSRIIVVYGESISRFKPRTYTLAFIGCDFLSLVLQGAGGGLASTAANSDSSTETGRNIMMGGLAFQVVATLMFMVASADFWWRVRRAGPDARDPSHETLRRSLKFRLFLWGLAVAVTCIFTRSVFRVAELSEGFDGKLANQEVTFMILEGAMMFISCTALTFLHPGYCFQGSWGAANFRLGRSKKENDGLPFSDKDGIVDGGSESSKETV
ncbi:RTA1 like protein-domain-containing protein [Lipomyces tetrasporus]|uniref:Sphingoid long-chain base transporter RSB1 n=1 Tax=Lipomyces tetrasporus TaxID=54092 RepID=A0AAD7QLL1_9ASCO|nr:RTA1 like protein-domain-containing protein [Lipomyces tetrasporus]KAJ8097170.1 RTA1 like protein-domain-containing protein [Lipomyces tetrasporus]